MMGNAFITFCYVLGQYSSEILLVYRDLNPFGLVLTGAALYRVTCCDFVFVDRFVFWCDSILVLPLISDACISLLYCSFITKTSEN